MKSKSKSRRKTKDSPELKALQIHIGKRIKYLRTALGWTQEDLAERMNEKGGSRISEFERGNYPIGLKVMLRFAQALNVDVSDLVKKDDKADGSVKKIVHGRVNDLSTSLDDLSKQLMRIQKELDKVKKSLEE